MIDQDNDTDRPLMRVERRCCPHCKKNLSLKTYKAHKRLYFNELDDSWVNLCAETESADADIPVNASSPPGSEIDDPSDILRMSPPAHDHDYENYTEDSELLGNSSDNVQEDFDSDSEVWMEDDGIGDDDKETVRPETPPGNDIEVEHEIEAKHLCDWLMKFLAHSQSLFHLSDVAMDCIIKFLAAFLLALGKFAPICSSIADHFPRSLHHFNVSACAQPVLHKFVACRKCHSVYLFDNCIEGHGVNQRSKDCPFQEFPNHPHQRMRKQCGNKLLKTVEMCSGRKFLYPFMTYCYIGLEASLTPFFQRPGFSKHLEHWKSRSNDESILTDVYDGKIWSEFLSYKNQPFLSQPLSLGLTINIDWFQPYKHVTYSVGAIYLVILNLPRHLRYKRENVILVGILPGPHEPSRDINSYLQPLVDELLGLWKGVSFNVHGFSTQKQVRCALLCASCDIPAGRKVCGFIGHTGHLGCSRCLKKFVGTVGDMNYGGFDRDKWPLRTNDAHRKAASKILNSTTKTERQGLESSTGFRYTVLLKLPYFNANRMLIVDPMHNLFLGSAKHVLKRIWLENGVIQPDDFKVIQERIDRCIVPSDIGRIPHKINSGFSSFTADQFKNWVVYFSLIGLRGILDGPELECWRHFVLACRILVQHELSLEQLSLSDALILYFCRRVERMYGSSSITPNMHLHCHLKECVLDYGPLHGFWCYPFERYNGLLGSLPNNNKSIEVQLINRFLRERALMDLPSPDTFVDEFSHLIPHSSKIVGSLLANMQGTADSQTPNLSSFSRYGVNHGIEVSLPQYYSNHVLNEEEVYELQLLYSKLYSRSDLEIYHAYRKYRTVQVNKKQLGSYQSRSSNASTVLAVWNHELFDDDGEQPIEYRPLRIKHFVQHVITIDNTNVSHLFLSVLWYKKHPNTNLLGKPITIWECDIFESRCTLVPIELIVCRTISLVDTIDDHSGSHALIVCPCIDF